MNIFFLFEKEYERSQVESIWEIELPIERIKKELEELYSVSYRSSTWIYTQLRRYEEDLGVQLFAKDSRGCGKGSFRLSICDRMLTFYQKQHLYVSDKIKVANGMYDKIINEARARQAAAVRLFLGAGTTLFHLSEIFARRSWQDPLRYSIYTHNLGALKRLLEPAVNSANLEVFTLRGRVDPATFAVLGEAAELRALPPLDYIIMGTSYVADGRLYVESVQETEMMKAILRQLSGEKVLILTKHEFSDQPPPGLQSYGRLEDYDFVLVPSGSLHRQEAKKYERIFEQYQGQFHPEIIHWNYAILRVKKAGSAQ